MSLAVVTAVDFFFSILDQNYYKRQWDHNSHLHEG